jgi:type I restriction enzyme S subunit
MTWPQIQLSKITSKIGSGATPKGGKEAYQAQGVPFIRSMNVHDGRFLDKGIAYLDLKQAKQLDIATLCKGDVLLNITGASVGRVCCLPDRYVGGRVNQHVAIIRPKPKHLLPRYLQYYLTDSETKANLLRIACAGATREAITKTAIEQLEIPLPPLEEQKRIAALLDHADELRRKRQRAIDRLNQLGQAIFYEMFGAIGSKMDTWPRKALGDICDLVRGSSPRPQGDPRYFGGSVPRLMIADITRDGMIVTPRIDSLTEEGAKKSRPMPAGSVVMAVSGAVGLPAILAVDACIHDGFVGFRSLDKSILPNFLYWFLSINREFNRAQGTGAIWVNLTTDQVKSFAVPVPPLSLQKQFVEKMQQVTEQAELFRDSLRLIEGLFSSLQHHAFHGEL